jgi:hypothetical protein
MKTAIGLACVLALIWASTGLAAEDTPEEVAKAYIKFMEDVTKVLSTIKDKASAKAAVPRLKKLGARGESLRKRREKLDLTDDKEQKKLDKKYGKKFRKAKADLGKERQRVSKVEGGREALAVLEPKPEKEKKDDDE